MLDLNSNDTNDVCVAEIDNQRNTTTTCTTTSCKTEDGKSSAPTRMNDNTQKSSSVNNSSNNALVYITPPPKSWFEKTTVGQKAKSDDCNDDAKGKSVTSSISKSTSKASSLPLEAEVKCDNNKSHSLTTPQIRRSKNDIEKSHFDSNVSLSNSSSACVQVTKMESIPVSENQRHDIGVVGLLRCNKNTVMRTALPAAHEIVSNTFDKVLYHGRRSYAMSQWHRGYSEYNSKTITGYYKPTSNDNEMLQQQQLLPPFSSLSWVERQMVHEWRTSYSQQQQECRSSNQNDTDDIAAAAISKVLPSTSSANNSVDDDEEGVMVVSVEDVPSDDEDDDEIEDDLFERARTLVPASSTKPKWKKMNHCGICHCQFRNSTTPDVVRCCAKAAGRRQRQSNDDEQQHDKTTSNQSRSQSTAAGLLLQLRHHCRMCGMSVCNDHSMHRQYIPQFGYYTVMERVCDKCHSIVLQQNLTERITWRALRCRDYLLGCSNEAGSGGRSANITNSYGNKSSDVDGETSTQPSSMSSLDTAHAEVTNASSNDGGGLQPYFETGHDTFELAIIRITNAALELARSIPLGAQATVAVETVDVLRKYGLTGIYTIVLRQEFLAAADLLLQALGINRDAWPLSVHELSAAIFYALAQHRAMRGMYPEREEYIHTTTDTALASSSLVDICSPDDFDNTAASPIDCNNNDERQQEYDIGNSKKSDSAFQPVCQELSDKDLAAMIMFAPIALNFIYVEKEVDMQLLAAQQGWRLVYAYLQQEDTGYKILHDRPASALFVHNEHKIACLAVRGTTTIHDVITDIRQVPVPFPAEDGADAAIGENGDEEWTNVFNGQGLAVAGMAGAAMNLYREHIDSLLLLARNGYRIRMTGHSLGGAVAALVGVLVYKDLMEEINNDIQQPSSSTNQSEAHDILHVYAFGTPSCVDLPLSEAVESFVTSIVLHDDVVPRLTPTSCRGLLKHLLHIRETWVREHFKDDIKAFTDRAKTAWAPRLRGGFTMSQNSSVKLQQYCKSKIRRSKATLRKFVGDKEQSSSFSRDSSKDDTDDQLSTGEKPTAHTSLVIDILGGDSGTAGLVVDGDEFFDPQDSLIEEAAVEPNVSRGGARSNFKSENYQAEEDTDRYNEVVNSFTESVSFEDDSSTAGPDVVMLEEAPLPRMYVPGKVVHIYSYRGTYKAAYAPRTFREVRNISLAGNMLSDHKTKSYFDALLEVSSVRRSVESPPRWTAFDEDDTCSCCASRFTWASTSDNEAQEARDKHNCRSCGSLVCEPCSSNRAPILSLGLNVAVRICDRCYNDIDGLLVAKPEISNDIVDNRSSREIDGSMQNTTASVKQKPSRKREKRSAVVDELAHRVQSSALKCCN